MSQPDTLIEVITNTLASTLATKFVDVLEYGGVTHATLNEDVLFEPNKTALRVRANASNEDRTDEAVNYPLEFINFWLDDIVLTEKRQRPGLGLTGVLPAEAQSTTTMPYFKAVPVTLKYSVSYWTKYLNKLEKFLRLARFWPFENPVLAATYVSGLTGDDDTEYPLKFPMIVGSDLTDLSSYEERFSRGSYWAKSLSITVEGWFVSTGSIYYCEEIRLKMYESFVVDPTTLVYSKTITE